MPTAPLSPAISQALTRCGVVNVGTWEVQLLANGGVVVRTSTHFSGMIVKVNNVAYQGSRHLQQRQQPDARSERFKWRTFFSL